MTYKANTLYTASELTNEQYHASTGWYSSSQLKKAMNDIELFHKLYITGEVTNDVSSNLQAAYNIGTYFHTAVLEPDTLKDTCAVWEKRRQGKAWEEFAQVNQNKCIITSSELGKANNLILAAKNNKYVQITMASGEPELSAYANLMGINVRVRADWINWETGVLMDLKSMSGNPKSSFAIAKKIDDLDYDLSAALYLDVFNAVATHHNQPPLHAFEWAFASKDRVACQMYRASIDSDLIKVGRKKYQFALKQIKAESKNGWEFPDRMLEAPVVQASKGHWLGGKEGTPDKAFDKPAKTKINSADML